MEKKDVRDELNEVRLKKEKLRLAQEKKEFEQTGKITYQSENKSELEFSRYKQDCRKRALDLAHSQCMDNERRGGEPYPHEYISELADKYYNWLISIPEK